MDAPRPRFLPADDEERPLCTPNHDAYDLGGLCYSKNSRDLKKEDDVAIYMVRLVAVEASLKSSLEWIYVTTHDNIYMLPVLSILEPSYPLLLFLLIRPSSESSWLDLTLCYKCVCNT